MTKIVASKRFVVKKRPRLRGWVVEDILTGMILLITSDRKEAERAAAELEERNPITGSGSISDDE